MSPKLKLYGKSAVHLKCNECKLTQVTTRYNVQPCI